MHKTVVPLVVAILLFCGTSTTANAAYPCICPNTPLFQDPDETWVWYAERYYGVGLNCSNCYIEPTTLVGNYGADSFAWPYPCGDDMCEPGYHLAYHSRPYSGRKMGAPVDFTYNPLSDIHPRVIAEEVSPRRYYSFVDKGKKPKTRYFIAYHIKTWTSQFWFAHEVDRDVLLREKVEITSLKADEVVPIKNLLGEPSYIYLQKKGYRPAETIFFLKSDVLETASISKK